MKISIEANGNKFDFRLTRPDKTAIDSVCRIVRAQSPDRKVAAKPKKQKPKAWRVILDDVGPSKINVIKAVRELIPDSNGSGLGLKEAKDMVETPHALMIARTDVTHAKVLKEAFGKVGATLRLEGLNK